MLFTENLGDLNLGELWKASILWICGWLKPCARFCFHSCYILVWFLAYLPRLIKLKYWLCYLLYKYLKLWNICNIYSSKLTKILSTVGNVWNQWYKKSFPSTQDLHNNQYSLDVQFSSVQSVSHVRLFATPWTVASQAPLSMEFSRQEYWSW